MSKVIDNSILAIAGINFPTPKWVISMASEYADRNGLPEITVADFFKTDEYRRQAERNVRAAERVGDADAIAVR